MAKKSLALVGADPEALGTGVIVPSVHQILSDARVMLSDEMANVAALRAMDRVDIEQSTKFIKNAHSRADALLKLLKAAQLLREETEAAAKERVAGKDLTALSDAQVEALVKETLVNAGDPEAP